MTMATLQTDGLSHGNPGPAGVGFALTLEDNTVYTGGCFIGETTDSVAEYTALVWGVENALAAGVTELAIEAASETMVNQLSGIYRVRNEGLKPLYAQARQLLASFEQTVLTHVPREENNQSAQIAEQAIEKLTTIGEYLSPPTMKQSLQTLADEREHEGEIIEMSYLPDMTYGAVPTSGGGRRDVAFGDLADDEAPVSAQVEVADEQGRTRSNSFVAATEDSPRKRAVTEPYSDRIADTVNSIHRHVEATGVYELTVTERFSAAHALRGYRGSAKNLHGHTWVVEATVEGNKLDHVGILYDFKNLRSDLRSVVSRYDNSYLNEVEPFNKINSTAENIARTIYERLDALLPEHVRVSEICVRQSREACVRYRRQRTKGTSRR